MNYKLFVSECVRRSSNNVRLILDAGCGRETHIRSVDAIEVINIDILRSNILANRASWKERGFILADLTMLPFIDGCFGGTLSVDVLEHVADKSAAVTELARCTKKGGFFVGCSSNLLNPAMYLDSKYPLIAKPIIAKFCGSGYYNRHSRFSPSSLVKTLRISGYDINSLYSIGFPQFLESNTFFGILVSHIWEFFDRFTDRMFLLYLKEILVWRATRL